MKKLFRDFIVFIFLTSLFFSILFFLNGEKFSYKDLKIIFDVDVDTSHLLSKNIEKNTECQKRKKGYYLYILFLLLVLFLLLIIVKLLLSLKHDCEKYEIYRCEKDKTYEDESMKLELDMSSSADEIEKNNEKINELSNEINAYMFQAKGGKFNKSSMPPKTGADQEYKYDTTSYATIKGFRVANFNPENQHNRSLFWKKESFRIKQQLTSFYGLQETDKETFSKLYDDELQRMNTASSDLDAFTNYYISKKTLMRKNERIDETLKQQAQKMKGVVNNDRRQNEKEMTKERIAFQKKDDMCKDFFENLNNNDDIKKIKNESLVTGYKNLIINIILQSMIENFMVTQKEPQNFITFCSKYYDVFKENNLFKKNFFSKQKKEEVLNSFEQSDGSKMSGNDREKMYYKFYFLAQKGIYFPLHEIANFHNLSLKVLTTQTEAHANKFINPQKSIKVRYDLVGEAINQLQGEIYNAVELIKRQVRLERVSSKSFRKQINQIKQVKREANKNINEKINEYLKRVSNNSRQKKQNIAEMREKYSYLRSKNKKQIQNNINPNIKTFKNSNDINDINLPGIKDFSLYSRNNPRSQSQFHQNKSTLSTRRKYQEASEKKKKNEDGNKKK